MIERIMLPRWIPLALLSALLPASTMATESLSDRSPFLPPGFQDRSERPPERQVERRAPVQPLASRLTFNGVMKRDGITRIALRDRSSGTGFWVPLNGSENGWTVHSFDAGKMVVRVSGEGISGELPLYSENRAVVAAAPLAPVNNASPGASPPVPNAQQNERGQAEQPKIPVRRRVIVPRADG